MSGKDGSIEALADSVFLAVQSYIAKALTAVSARADSLEKRVSDIPAGPKGERGERGERGADSTVVADGIVESKSYPRGTFAVFHGGMFHAQRATDPLGSKTLAEAGWCCIFRGIAASTSTLEDGGRYLVNTVTFSDGTQEVSRLKTAMAIYRGVHQPAHKYDAGDTVTFDGSQWTAKVDTDERPRARPLDAPQVWQLSTKRGAPGKDATPREAT
jgi:hypothetical protein